MSTLKTVFAFFSLFVFTLVGATSASANATLLAGGLAAELSPSSLTAVEDPEPFFLAGNPSCSTLNGMNDDFPAVTSNYGFKLNGLPDNGRYYFTSGMTGGAPPDPLSYVDITQVTFTSPEGMGISWASNRTMFAVIVKGGPVANIYYFGPDGSLTGFEHHPPINPSNGKYYGVSHVEFCFGDRNEPALDPITAEKTANASYERTVEWKIEKTVDDDSHSGTAGSDAGSSTWKVVATKEQKEDKFSVTGNITIHNTNLIPVKVNVSDTLDEQSVMNVDCDPNTEGDQNQNMTVPAGELNGPAGQLVCTYKGDPADRSATENIADVESLTDGVAGTQATADVNWDETLIGDDTVTLGDERFKHSESISSTTTENFPETFPCPSDPTQYTNGVHQRTETNIATLKGDDTDLSDDASVEINCTLAALTVSKTAAGSYDTEHSWTLAKSASPTSFTGYAGQTFNPADLWTVVADKTTTSGNYAVSGKVTIGNPAGISQTFSVADMLSNGTNVTVTCSSYTLLPGASIECSYSASQSDASATKNTAKVSAPGNADQFAEAAISFTENVKGDNSTTLGDARFSFSQSISADTTKKFNDSFSCPTDLTLYVNGTYSFSVKNTATLKGAVTDLTKDATVNVTCNLRYSNETATGKGKGWPGENWFMYTKCTDALSPLKVDLIAGQFYDAGDITITGTCENSKTGTNTITITLAPGYRLANVSNNVKINPMSSEPKSYISPGQFSIKKTFAQGTTTIVVSVPKNLYYGIHLDVQRPVFP